MAEIKIPDCLKGNPSTTENKISELISQYEKKFGRTSSTEPFDFLEEELIKVFETCLKEKRTFYDVLGFNPNAIEEEEEW